MSFGKKGKRGRGIRYGGVLTGVVGKVSDKKIGSNQFGGGQREGGPVLAATIVGVGGGGSGGVKSGLLSLRKGGKGRGEILWAHLSESDANGRRGGGRVSQKNHGERKAQKFFPKRKGKKGCSGRTSAVTVRRLGAVVCKYEGTRTKDRGRVSWIGLKP